jgi:hypothetical protein
MIREPGIYRDVSANDYHADPCPAPSLTQSVAKILLDRSPLHAWHAHPRLNPGYQHDDDTKFDVGNVAHKLMLGRGKEVVALDAPDWNATGMGKGAKTKLHEERDLLRSQGKLAVLGKTVARADRMVKAAREQLELRGLGHLFGEHGDSEVVIAWQERAGGLWCRQMVDWLSTDRLIFADYKTSDLSAAPDGLGRVMVNAGWPVQAAFAERGLDEIDPDNAGRRQFLFVMQEATVPYALTVARMSEGALTMGRKQVEEAYRVWLSCLLNNRWPGYPTEIVTPEYPGWHEAAVLTREVARYEREPMLQDLSGG